jgi:alkanesulfonate monooxygenase SsuD/methylene tetrahydromethanopterin reductase-like flavin-dependent oxidoreductase (luciferase family)
LRSGRPEAMATPEEAAAYPYSDREREFILERRDGQALGSPSTVRGQLTELLDRTQADEFMLTCMVYDVDARARSFELIREHVAPHLTR